MNLTGRPEHFCPQYNECVMDMKAEMGSSLKAMIRSEILFDNIPNKQKQTAKKRNRKDKVAQRSLITVEEKDSISDTNEDAQPAFGVDAIVGKSQKYLSPRTINAHPWLAGMKRHDLDRIEQVKESEASVGRRESLDKVEAYLATYESCTNKLFGAPKIQEPAES
jgi:hypothetical protein